jgi:enoyl-CoA hydratase
MTGSVRLEKEGSIGWVIFDHEARRNALTLSMWQQIPEVVAQIEADDTIRVAVMRGAGEVAFVSGADISQFTEARMGDAAREYDVANTAAFDALSKVEKPLLVAVHGFCVGGGLAIAATADLRYSAEDGRFGIPAVKLGLGYSLEGIEKLSRIVGMPRAKEILFTAQRFTAEQALAMGLINGVFPKAELLSKVREIAQTIADNAPLSVRSAKRCAIEIDKPANERDMKRVQAGIDACFNSADYAEGVAAFLEKRSARFSGK